jgi:hypothetical protein
MSQPRTQDHLPGVRKRSFAFPAAQVAQGPVKEVLGGSRKCSLSAPQNVSTERMDLFDHILLSIDDSEYTKGMLGFVSGPSARALEVWLPESNMESKTHLER